MKGLFFQHYSSRLMKKEILKSKDYVTLLDKI